MRAFNFRLYALVLRFLCPLAVLFLTNPEMMGQYYIFISYFTFAVTISGLELAVPFASKFLRGKTERQRDIILNAFIKNQIALTLFISLPASVIIANMIEIPSTLVPFLFVALASESTVNELNRFYWNIGLVLKPSVRDLMRSFVFAVSVVGSVLLYENILTIFTFLFIIIGNFAILMIEFKTILSRFNNLNGNLLYKIQKLCLRVRQTVSSSIPYFFHMQILGIQPLLERTLIEKSFGFTQVAAFAFTISIVQTSAGLLLLPYISAVKSKIIGVREMNEWKLVKKLSLKLLLKIILVSGTLSGIVFLIIPILNTITNKELPLSAMLVFSAFATTVASVFCSSVSPVITKRGRGIKENIYSFLILLPLFFVNILPTEVELLNTSLHIIATIAILLMAHRIYLIIILKI